MPDRWTSDHLLSEEGVHIYADQIRALFRDYGDDFRTLSREVRGDLVADPPEGDNAIQARLHAWLVARSLREMAHHAEQIVAAARKVEKDYERYCVKLPKARERKAERKALEKQGRKSLSPPSGSGPAGPGGVADRVAAQSAAPKSGSNFSDHRTPAIQAEQPPQAAFEDLFTKAAG